jgi:hypothetical protein
VRPFFWKKEVMEKEQKKKPTSANGRHLTTKEAAEAISLWAAGNVTLEQLAQKFGKNHSTFIRLFNKHNVAKGEKAEEQTQMIAKEIEKNSVDDAAKVTERIRETKDNSYKLATAIERALTKEYVEGQRSGNFASKLGNVKTLELMAKALKVTREERYAVLGIADGEKGDDDDIPDLNVHELTVEEIKQIQKATLEETKQDDLDVSTADMEIDFEDEDDEQPDGVTT